MKTALGEAAAAPIVQLAGGVEAAVGRQDVAADRAVVDRARAFAEPLLAGERFDTGEEALAHADGVSAILSSVGAAPSLQAVAYLLYSAEYLARPDEVLAKAYGPGYASLVLHTRRLVQVQRNAREALGGDESDAAHQAERVERVRKMLLAFSRDLRVVLLRLSSRLQTLRWYAASKQTCPSVMAQEAMQVFAPLASRLGIWQIKWELEDLAFRFTEPAEYRRIAALLDEKRVVRERQVELARTELAAALQAIGLRCEVQGRPKHLYSIWKKMQGKQLAFDEVHDLRALRVIVDDVSACYTALGRVHELWTPMPSEFDDYIAKPKANGYRSLHTVVRDAQGHSIEIQIRTSEMHEHAESGVAAHWAYKEAGSKGYGGVSATGEFEEQLAQARKAVLRQLLAWERELADPAAAAQGFFEDRIYVFTPQAAVIELPAGATAVDFAYALHTDLGHRCRGARVDGAMLPLQTSLTNGQTVEVVVAREGGPSLDWLNPELGYLKSPRARAKVRAWFNARAQGETVSRGREAVEKLLQREGRTAIRHDELAAQLGFRDAAALFEVVGKDELSLRHIEQLLRPSEPLPDPDALIARRLTRTPVEDGASKGGVLVVGVESLLTTLARCCRPAPPDVIDGYVTRGKGVAVHRRDCSNLRHMRERAPERLVPVAWGRSAVAAQQRYPVDLLVEARERPGLLRDMTEVLAKERVDVSGVHTQHGRGAGATQTMTLTIDIDSSERLARVLSQLAQVSGVLRARRR